MNTEAYEHGVADQKNGRVELVALLVAADAIDYAKEYSAGYWAYANTGETRVHRSFRQRSGDKRANG